MENFHSGSCELELDSEALGEVRAKAAEILIAKGSKTIEADNQSPDRGPAYLYSVQLSSEDTRRIFAIDEDEIICGCCIEYAPEFILDDSRYQDELYVAIRTCLERDEAMPIDILRWLSIGGRYGEPVQGLCNTEYSVDGYRISPNNLPPMNFSDMTLSDQQRLVEDMTTLTRSMTMKDVERILSALAAIRDN